MDKMRLDHLILWTKTEMKTQAYKFFWVTILQSWKWNKSQFLRIETIYNKIWEG